MRIAESLLVSSASAVRGNNLPIRYDAVPAFSAALNKSTSSAAVKRGSRFLKILRWVGGAVASVLMPKSSTVQLGAREQARFDDRFGPAYRCRRRGD